MIYDFLNVRNSTRALSDEKFTELVPVLAKEMLTVDFKTTFSDEILRSDWEKLKNWSSETDTSNSTVRVGMKLCEHFFPNFYDIKSASGKSFSNSWNQQNLEKILKWNRKSHSTPYLSEIKRGIYFCCGLSKNTMYRPHMAKMITSKLEGNIVLDPCAGWGGRLLGTVASGKKYIGFETNKETYANLLRMVEFLGIQQHVTLFNTGSENMAACLTDKVDIILTSPPYFNLEIYSDDKTQSENLYNTYPEWLSGWLEPVVKLGISFLNDSGASCWNVHDVGKMKMISDIKKIHESLNFHQTRTFSLDSSKRQANQGEKKNIKNSDSTIVYKRS